MVAYIALLRGINVSGKNKLPMADLRALCADLGWENTETYIQSGNVKLPLPEGQALGSLANMLHQGIQSRLGYDVPVLVRPQSYFQTLLEQHPAADVATDTKFLHFTLLAKVSTAEKIEALTAKDWGTDQAWVIDQCVYLYCPKGYGRTKLTNTYLEKQLGVVATTRNWRTIQKLAAW